MPYAREPSARRRTLLAAVVGLVGLVLAGLPAIPTAAAAAATAGPPSATLPAPTVSPSTIPAGTIATVSGARCRANSTSTPAQVMVSLVDTTGKVLTVHRVQVPASGAWTVALTPPVATPTGTYTVAATCDRYTDDSAYAPRTVTVTATTADAWTPQAPDLPSVPNGHFSDLDCAAVTSCVAVGWFQRDGAATVLVETWNGAAWAVADVPAPDDVDAAFVYGVSCASATDCIVVGDADYETADGAGYRPYVATLRGTTWTSQLLPPPAGRPEASLRAVSCPTAVSCVAVGATGYLAEGSQISPTAYRYDGGAWKLIPPAAAGTSGSSFAAVSCPTTTSCTAVGNDASTYPSTPFLQVLTGRTWQVEPLADVGAARTYVNGIACTAPAACVVVGTITPADPQSGDRFPLVETSSRGAWSVAAIAPRIGNVPGSLTDVDCASPSRCTAIGQTNPSGAPSAPIALRRGATWAPQAVTATATARLAGVTCPDTSTCVAVGTAGGEPVALAATGTAAFTDTSAIAPDGFIGGEFAAVSCSSGNACTAVGWANDHDNASIPFVDRWDGTSWSRQPLPDLGDARLSGVSCTARSQCVAAGRVGSASDAQPLVVTWDGSAWSRTAIARVTPSTVGQLVAVACASTTACLAVGQSTEYGGTPVAARLTGAQWALTPTPPVGGLTYVTLSGVSCPAVGACRAVGKGSDFGTPGEQGIDLTWNGSAWSTGPPVSPVAAVSCVSPTSCLAVPRSAGNVEFDAARWDGTTWTNEVMPDPSTYTYAQIDANAVVCRGSLSCTAVGFSSGGLYVARRSTAGSWRLEPVATELPYGGELNGVACPTDTRCVAVGRSGEVPTIFVSSAG